MNKNRLLSSAIALTLAFSMTGTNLSAVLAAETTEPQITTVAAASNVITASYDQAVSEIIIPRYESDGHKTRQKVSDTLKSHLDTTDLTGVVNKKKKTIKVDVQLKNVFLNTDYLNGKSEAGMGYYNMLNYYTSVKQVKQMLDSYKGYKVVDSKGNKLSKTYINEYLGLLDQINDMDPTTNLKYDWNSAYNTKSFKKNTTRGGTDVIATSKKGNCKLEFHIDSHGWWGYDLGAHDSITGVVMGEDAETAYEDQHSMTMQYANFFVIKMGSDKNGTWYMLNNTDLENPMIYVSKDKKEAFMIDVDFYGANVLNKVIKSVIGSKCKSLKIFCTHNHGDHCNNLAVIGKDKKLRNITTIIWPEYEPHTTLTAKDSTDKVSDLVGKDLINDIDWKDVKTIKDNQKIKAAGCTFQFVEIADEHTPGGGQLADLTHKVIYSGDSLGAQVHLGGTTVRLSAAKEWLAGAKKAAAYIKKNKIRYNIGAHTPYLNNPNYANWLATCLQYAYDQYDAGTLGGYTLIVSEKGKVINGTDRYSEIFTTGLTDREELDFCSVSVINNLSE